MTKAEAIEWLEKAKAETTAIAKDIPTTGEYANSLITAIELVDALNMAIQALEQERPEIIRCKNCRHDNNCEIQYSAEAGSKFFCGSAERREK